MAAIPKILIVDDEPRMCDSLKQLLSNQGYEISTANSGREALGYLSRNNIDLALFDIVMPDMGGLKLIDYVKIMNPEVPVVIITGHASVDSAIEALRKGAYDYIRKPFEFERLLKTVKNALNQKKLKKENKIVNEKLGISEERYQYLVQNSPDIIYTLDDNGNFKFINKAIENLLCYKVEQLIGKHYADIICEDDKKKAEYFFNERRTGDRANSGIELRLVNKSNDDEPCNSRYLTVDLKSTGMYEKSKKNKKFIGTYGVARDLSDRKFLEAQLQQTLKIEAISTLAGGIAHGFNNLLMGIQGNASLMLLGIDCSHPWHEKLKNIEHHVQNGAELTKQLLDFSRGGKYEVKSANLNDIVKDSSEIFGRTRKEITIHTKYQKDIWLAKVDLGQIEQVLLNFYVNSWQAMPEGGDLYIHTENVLLNKDYVKPFNIKPGKYVKISVTDTGTGMDEETKKRIFDPFFTTKEMSRKGAGLGLASSYGIIKNHKGIIKVESNKDKGTTFVVYLPALEKEFIKEDKLSDDNLVGRDTVLLVDDEDMIIDVGKEILDKMGYRVLTAGSGKEAIEIYKQNQDRIDIVILDMIMPDMGGEETYERLKEINMNAKVLLSSGYSINGLAAEILERGCDGFIQKPFKIKDLSEKLREILK